jgi:hypothetical protein
MHQLDDRTDDSMFSLDGVEQIHEDHFGTSPDFLGKSVERLYEFIRKFI